MTTMWLPTRADLDAATARTAAAIADPSASPADVERAAELEEKCSPPTPGGPAPRLSSPPACT
jgi:hypothetical protein